jgi:hypothetical protein
MSESSTELNMQALLDHAISCAILFTNKNLSTSDKIMLCQNPHPSPVRYQMPIGFQLKGKLIFSV